MNADHLATEKVAGPAGLSSEVLLPGDAGYDDARSVQNGLIDKRPAVIVACGSDEDVVEAVNFARESGLEISIKCGGHHVAGVAVSEGGVMLDLGGLNAIEVDPDACVVRAGGGLTWGELIGATQAHGLATPSGTDGAVGIAGLTLGGGVGWMLPKHGLASDNLLAARIVTADGRVLTTSAVEHPDLFWALRGGGGNFGVVTEFTYRLHPLGPMITGGLIMHPIDAAADLLRFYRDYTARGLSDDASVWALLLHAPDGSGIPVVALGVVHLGTEEEAQREFEPLLAYGSPLKVLYGPRPYTSWLQGLGDATRKGLRNDVRSRFLRELSDEAIDTLAESFASCPSSLSVITIEHFHGEVTRVPVEATAVSYRKDGYNFKVYGAWQNPATDDENLAWTQDTYGAMAPYVDDFLFPNYVGADEIDDQEVASRAYGSNLERLIDVKTAYDPQNLFRLNLNIRPRDVP